MNALLALAARAVTMMISLVCGVLTTRLALGSAGVEYFALYTVLIGIPAFLAFTDLGSGAVLVNTVATNDGFRKDPIAIGQLRSVWRIMLLFAATTMFVNSALLFTGGWEVILGTPGSLPNAPLAAFTCLAVFSLAIPFGVWTRILLGQRRNHIVILIQGLISPLTLLAVWLMLMFGTRFVLPFLVLGSYLATAIVAMVGFAVTATLSRPFMHTSAHHLLAPRRFRGLPVMDVGLPMLAQLLSPSIAVSTQRFVLAHQSSHTPVAEYGVAGQVFFALQGLVLAAGVALWPLYARRRQQGKLLRGPARQSAIFGGGVLLATAVIWLAGPWIFGFITDGTLEVEGSTIIAFGLMIAAIATVYPLGMFIMDKPGIRFQVVPTLAMACVSLTLAITLAPALGAAGPPLGNAIAVVTCQVIPFAIYIQRHRARLLSRSDRQTEPVAAELQSGSSQ